MVSDVPGDRGMSGVQTVSIRFEVRGGFRLLTTFGAGKWIVFQSALRFAVVSDLANYLLAVFGAGFQSALRFAVVSDVLYSGGEIVDTLVSIRFEVRGGFRLLLLLSRPSSFCFNPL